MTFSWLAGSRMPNASRGSCACSRPARSPGASGRRGARRPRREPSRRGPTPRRAVARGETARDRVVERQAERRLREGRARRLAVMPIASSVMRIVHGVASPSRAMNTSSSDVGIGRTLVACRPAASSAARRRASTPGSARSTRTCARSPNIWTSVTPGVRFSTRTPDGARRRSPRTARRAACGAAPRGVEREQPAVVQQRHPAAALGLVQVRRRHQDRDPLREKLREEHPELAARHRIDAGRRLVEHDQVRLVDERAGQRQLLLHAARQPIGQPRAERRELRQLEQSVAARRVVVHAVDLGEERDVLVDAQIAVEAEALREVADRTGEAAMVGDRVERRARGGCPRRPG